MASLLTSTTVEDESSGKGKAIAVFTSGGDSPGMNAAVRSVVRMTLSFGAEAWVILEGYQGLVDGGPLIKKMVIDGLDSSHYHQIHSHSPNIKLQSWGDVAGILSQGGTAIGTARCKEFRERSGRLKAAKNLVERGISHLICIGGDGSLTGADLFKKEWQNLLEELVASKRITNEMASKASYLSVVGLVGSIDNDMCGTDQTIGADSALHRIIECADSIMSTAKSHQRTFVLEVMGRHCGYLALASAIATGADWVLIPECPPESGWEHVMCNELSRGRKLGKRMSLVIVAEGAVDIDGKQISSFYVKKVLEECLGHDTRVTILGHVQRGGAPSAYDRILGTFMGFDAVKNILQSGPDTAPVIIGVKKSQLVHPGLVESVKQTREIGSALEKKEFMKALELRGPDFLESFLFLQRVNCVEPLSSVQKQQTDPSCGKFSIPPAWNQLLKHRQADDFSMSPMTVAVLHTGAPAAGMNAAVRAVVRVSLDHGHHVFGVHDGFEGLAKGDIVPMDWMSVDGWCSVGGAYLGTNRTQPDELIPQILTSLAKFNINALILIGGFEGFTGMLRLVKARSQYEELRIPMVCIPATVSNNVPGSEYSIGSDTALNAIVEACDRIKQSASASRKRVFIVETMGGYCGYLATMGALASGAERAYTYEEGTTLSNLQDDLIHMKRRFKENNQCGMLLRCEKSSDSYNTNVIHTIFSAEGEGVFTTRCAILGHIQQGGNPSPFDRIEAMKLSMHGIRFLEEQHIKGGPYNTDSSACLVGIQNGKNVVTPLTDLAALTDFRHRLPKEQFWTQNATKFVRLLAKYDFYSQ